MHTPNMIQRFLLRLWAWWDTLFQPQDELIGAWGERWAARYLLLSGCRILARNIHPVRHGELDIIARQWGKTRFVEVKTRRNETVGRPLDAVNHQKRLNIRRCATAWLSQHHLLGTSHLYRFDVIEVIGMPKDGVPIIRWIPGINMDETPHPEI